MIDIEKFICSLLEDHPVGITVRSDIHRALKDQGLEYKDGKIVPIESENELKESEDERIKSAVIEFVRQNNSFNYSLGISKEDAIAWLEKQGKNNMGISESTKQKLEDNLNKALEKETSESWNEFLDKQCKQKATDKIQIGKEYRCIASPRYSTFITDKIYKPEDKFLCSLMNFCSDCFELVEISESKELEPPYKCEVLPHSKKGLIYKYG